MMINDKPVTSLTEAELSALVDNEPERKTLEYKRELPGNSEKDRKEFLYDASSFANTRGGYLSGPKGGRYLRCSGAVRRFGNCAAASWKYDSFETSFFYFVKEIDLGSVLNAATDRTALEHLDGKVTAAEERLRLLTLRRDRTFELLDEPTTSTSYIRERLADCETQILATEAILETLAGERFALLEHPAISSTELQGQIAALKELAGVEAFDHRVRLATKLHEAIGSLRLATEGRRPKLANTRKFLEENEADASYRETLLTYMAESDAQVGLNNPTFTVQFASGLSRTLVVNPSDPTRYVQEAVVEADGNAVVTRPNGWAWTWPPTS